MVAIAAVTVIGLGYGIAADRLAGRRRSLTVTGVVLMAVVGAVAGLVALFSAGF
jgi:ABC-type maltose transport system permease subunit